jgi:hypothetical protein
MVLDGPINRLAFQAYVEQVLVPELSPGDIVVMDNLSSHQGPAVCQAIAATGARLLYLPPYSPDFNPIENAFAKLKACCARPLNPPSMASGTPSATSSTSSRPANVPTTSPQLDTSRIKTNPLLAAGPMPKMARGGSELRSARSADRFERFSTSNQ